LVSGVRKLLRTARDWPLAAAAPRGRVKNRVGPLRYADWVCFARIRKWLSEIGSHKFKLCRCRNGKTNPFGKTAADSMRPRYCRSLQSAMQRFEMHTEFASGV